MPMSLTRGAANLGWLVVAITVLPAAASCSGVSPDLPANHDQIDRSASAAGAASLQCVQALRVAGGPADSGPHAELQARHNAIESWRTQVSDRFGYDYAQWWRAREKIVSCLTTGTSMRCEALAVPCMAQGGAQAGAAPMAPMSGLGMADRGR